MTLLNVTETTELAGKAVVTGIVTTPLTTVQVTETPFTVTET